MPTSLNFSSAGSETEETRVRGALFRFYGAAGAAAITVLGYVGYDLIAEMRNSADDKAAEIISATVQPRIHDAEKILMRIEIDHAVLEKLAERNTGSINEIERLLGEVRPKVKEMETISDQLEDFRNRGKALEADIARYAESAAAVEGLAERVSELSTQTATIAKVASEATTTTKAELGLVSQNSSLIADQSSAISQNIAEARSRPIAFLQYYGMPRETAQALAKKIGDHGFLLPAVDEEPMSQAGMFEVRFFHHSDHEAAVRLGNAAKQSLEELALPTGPIKITDVTGWPRSKPKPGTLEVWLGLPAQGAAD